jgi:hypothetical protein
LVAELELQAVRVRKHLFPLEVRHHLSKKLTLPSSPQKVDKVGEAKNQ